jgi:hypothetical protein
LSKSSGNHRRRKKVKKTIIAFAVLGILLLASIGAYASSISDKQAQAWEQALKGESRADLPEWIFHGLTALGTANMVQCNGETYLVRQQCKPHDCGNNFIISAYQPSSQKAWGMIVEVKDVPEAIDTPSKYARYIYRQAGQGDPISSDGTTEGRSKLEVSESLRF